MTGRSGGREVAVHVIAAVAGPGLALALLGSADAAVLWRTAFVSVGLTLVGAGLLGAVRLARAEWRRETPQFRSYAGVLARFAGAFVLVVAGTS